MSFLSSDRVERPGASGPDRGPLMRVSDNFLKALGIQKARSKKRKHCTESIDIELGGSINIRVHPSCPGQDGITMIPCLLLHRSSLPLVFLKSNTNADDSPNSRTFKGHIPVLETCEPGSAENKERKILVAMDGRGRLWVIEGVGKSIYVMCKLNDWVTLEDFDRKPPKASRTCPHASTENGTENRSWWKTAAVDVDLHYGKGTVSARGPAKASVLGLSMKPLHARLASGVPSIEPLVAQHVETFQPPAGVAFGLDGQEYKDALPDSQPEDAFAMVRAQYMEALYMSKTSLAYFAKGPLSRARVSTQQLNLSTTSPNDLAQYLRENVLSVQTNSKKYEKTLPGLIAELPVGITFGDEDDQMNSRMRKSKKRKKVGKDGLFPGEESYVLKWWLKREDALPLQGPEDTREQRVKNSLVEQRARETQLQIILILEILAIEAASSAQSRTDHMRLGGGYERNNAERPTESKAPKKPQDLSTLLDILIERLCIWQSTNHDDSVSVGKLSSTTEKTMEHLEAHVGNGDRLRGFCAEVIIPFYATRLPNLYQTVCKQLGGTLEPSPPRPLLHKMITTSRIGPKGGTSIQRSQNRKPRQTIERVLTDNKIVSQHRPPSLARSATDSALPKLKRELNEAPLSAIPPTKRMLLQSRREVDLTAIFQATEAKRKRKEAIDEELQSAIAALKKPNPRLAVKDLVESAERRTGRIDAKSRKSRNPVHNPFAPGVQVMATPKGKRRHDHYPELPPLPTNHNTQSQEPDVIPTSSDPCIPSSSIKPPAGPPLGSSSIVPTPFSIYPSVEQTPSRKASKLAKSSLNASMSLDQDKDELSLPSPDFLPMNKKAMNAFKRPPAPGRTPSADSLTALRSVTNTPSRTPQMRLKGLGLVPGTPAKGHKNVRADVEHAEVALTTKNVGAANYAADAVPLGGGSIYEALGWNDTEVDDLI